MKGAAIIIAWAEAALSAWNASLGNYGTAVLCGLGTFIVLFTGQDQK